MSLDPMLVVLQFNQYINDRDIRNLAEMIHEDYVFISISNQREPGRKQNIAGWTGFFQLYPDYRNHFELVVPRGNRVNAAGYSTCSYNPLAGPAIWSALVRDGKIAEWRIFLDSPVNRADLGLPPKFSMEQ